MRRIAIIFAAVATLLSCSKPNEPEDANVTNLTRALAWYANSGLTITKEEFINVAGSQISVGEQTHNLLYSMSFHQPGSGTLRAYYQKQVVLGAHMNYDYANLTFAWSYVGEVLTINFNEDDKVIPKQLTIKVDYCWSESFKGILNGKPFSMFTDKTYVEKK